MLSFILLTSLISFTSADILIHVYVLTLFPLRSRSRWSWLPCWPPCPSRHTWTSYGRPMEPRTRSTDLSRGEHLDKKVRCFVFGVSMLLIWFYLFFFNVHVFFVSAKALGHTCIRTKNYVLYRTFPCLSLHNSRSWKYSCSVQNITNKSVICLFLSLGIKIYFSWR